MRHDPALLVSYVWCHRCSIWARQGFSPRWRTLICLSPVSRRLALWPARWDRSPVSHVFNRLRQNRRWWLAPRLCFQRCLAISAIPTCLFLHCVLAKPPMRLWPNTGWKLRWWIIALRLLISIIFFLPMYGVLLKLMLLKSWQINLKFPHYRQVKGSFSELCDKMGE